MLTVAHSIFDTTALLKWIGSEFDTPALRTCVFHRSFVNDTYAVVTAGGRFYLRVYQAGWRTLAEVQDELAAIEALHTAGASVARPVSLRAGGFVALAQAPEEVRPAVLFREALGSELSYHGAAGLDNARRYGNAVALFHAAAAGVSPLANRPSMGLDALIDEPVAVVGRLLDESDRTALARVGERLRERLSATSELTVGLCHGDFNSTNIHFTDSDATIFDLDCCHWGWVANDIAGFGRGITLGRRPGESADALMRAFLEGYRLIRPIPTRDCEVLPTFLLAQRIWMASLHIKGAHRWGSYHFGPPYAKRLMDWLQAWEGSASLRVWVD